MDKQKAQRSKTVNTMSIEASWKQKSITTAPVRSKKHIQQENPVYGKALAILLPI
jgi:hypothetical protein